jgi:hypothetical protein
MSSGGAASVVKTMAWNRVAGAPEELAASGGDGVGEGGRLQDQQDGLFKEPAIGPDKSHRHADHKEGQHLREERRDISGGCGVAAPEPDVGDAAGLCQDPREKAEASWCLVPPSAGLVVELQ